MHLALTNPGTVAFLGNISVGSVYARGLIAVFAIQAIALGIYLVKRARCQLRFLDEAAKDRYRQDASCGPTQQHPKKDVLVN
jgi:hypothetical protein